jgi:hypothetical protein
MNIKEMKSEVEKYRGKLRERPAKLVSSGPSGPVGMELIDVLVDGIESLEKRVATLEKSS